MSTKVATLPLRSAGKMMNNSSNPYPLRHPLTPRLEVDVTPDDVKRFLLRCADVAWRDSIAASGKAHGSLPPNTTTAPPGSSNHPLHGKGSLGGGERNTASLASSIRSTTPSDNLTLPGTSYIPSYHRFVADMSSPIAVKKRKGLKRFTAGSPITTKQLFNRSTGTFHSQTTRRRGSAATQPLHSSASDRKHSSGSGAMAASPSLPPSAPFDQRLTIPLRRCCSSSDGEAALMQGRSPQAQPLTLMTTAAVAALCKAKGRCPLPWTNRRRHHRFLGRMALALRLAWTASFGRAN